MKKLLAILLCALICAACVAPAALADSGISVTVNDTAVKWTDAAPFIDANNRTLCPLRAVADAMGLTVTWDGAARTATFIMTGVDKDGYGREYSYVRSMMFTINSSTAAWEESNYYDDGYDEHGGWPVEMDTAPVIVNSRTYAPLRYLAEAFDYSVGWNGKSRTVTVEDSYISPPYYAMDSGEWIALRTDPSKGYENVTKVEIISARVNGTDAEIQSTKDEYIPHGAIYEVAIVTDAAFTANDVIETEYRVTLKDGSSVIRAYAQRYCDYFPGGIVPPQA